MEVKLVAITKPLVKGIETVDEFVAYAARVSNPHNQMNTLTAPKLIKYLLKHKHFSPFEMVSCTMEITTTRDISHQIIRHRSFSYQEFSQRYADPTTDLGFSTSEARLQDHKNRQNSIEIDLSKTITDMSTFSELPLIDWWRDEQERVVRNAERVYKKAINYGLAKEVARKVLPEGLTETRLFMSGTLRSWIHYVDVRAQKDTQKEHRLIAEKVKDEIVSHFPSVSEYFEGSSAGDA